MALTEKERQWIECHFNKLNELVTLLRIDVAKLKVKAGIWGVIGGVIPVVAYILIRRI